jgi:cobalt/nickel transport system ATP-binding protein
MHFDMEKALFGGRSHLNFSVQCRFIILVIGIFAALLSRAVWVHLVIGLLGFILMILDRVAVIRIVIPLVLSFNIAIIMVVWTIFGVQIEKLVPGLSRTLACTMILSWFGGTVSWTALKVKLLFENRLDSLAYFIDYGILQGFILVGQILRRLDAAMVRIGPIYRRPQIVADAIAGGIGSAFERSLVLENARQLRQSRTEKSLEVLSVQAPKGGPLLSHVPVVSVQNANVISQNGRAILSDINFSLQTGEWLYIAGPSGSGKTTLLRAMAGLDKLTAGTMICVGNRTVSRQQPIPEVGFVFQNPEDQFFATTPREDIVWGLTCRGYSRSEAYKVAKDVLVALELERCGDQPMSQLSFGEKKRVAFAGVLAVKPKVLLCDEPTSGLDPLASHDLISLLDRISSEESMTIIWVSHDIHLVPPKVTKALLIRDGRQIFFGNRKDAFSFEQLSLAGLARVSFDESRNS